MSFRSLAQRTSEDISPPAWSKGTAPKHEFTGHESPIWDFVFLHDNVHVVSCSEDGTMRKWDCDTGLLVGEPWKGKGGSIYVLALSPDGETIACGRGDGSVQRWDTNGGLIEPIWTRHSNWVRALSWSPSGNHLASGSDDGRILIRKAESGKLGARPIKTKQGWVLALAYSPTGDRIASGGHNKTICIWDSKTGQCLVGPIEELGSRVESVLWSPDGSKFYSASDQFARVFESASGTLLHRFEHNHPLWSIALSPNRNILACVGRSGIVQLWDTESHQSLGQQETSHGKDLRYFASFSRNGRYLAYGGEDQKITLWRVDDIAPQFALTASTTLPSSSEVLEEKRQHGTEPESSSYLDVDATKPCPQSLGVDEDPYCNSFFQPSGPSLPSPMRRLWRAVILPSLLRPNEFMRLERIKRRFLRRTLASPPLPAPAGSEPTEQALEEETGARNGNGNQNQNEERHNVDLPNCPTKIALGDVEQNNDGAKQTENPLVDAPVQTPTPDRGGPSLPTSGSNENWTLRGFLMGIQRKNTTSVRAPAKIVCNTSPEVAQVYAARGFRRYVAFTRNHKGKSQTLTTGVPTVAGSAQLHAGTSSHDSHVHGHTSSKVTSVPAKSPATHGGQHSQGLTYSCNDDARSDSSIQGFWYNFLIKICYPCGRYDDELSTRM